jgi:hypothetical protein
MLAVSIYILYLMLTYKWWWYGFKWN